MFETQLDEICLFALQNKKKSFTFDDKKADEVKNFGKADTLSINEDNGEGVANKFQRKGRAASLNSLPSPGGRSNGSAFTAASHTAICSPHYDL